MYRPRLGTIRVPPSWRLLLSAPKRARRRKTKSTLRSTQTLALYNGQLRAGFKDGAHILNTAQTRHKLDNAREPGGGGVGSDHPLPPAAARVRKVEPPQNIQRCLVTIS